MHSCEAWVCPPRMNGFRPAARFRVPAALLLSAVELAVGLGAPRGRTKTSAPALVRETRRLPPSHYLRQGPVDGGIDHAAGEVAEALDGEFGGHLVLVGP